MLFVPLYRLEGFKWDSNNVLDPLGCEHTKTL